MDFLSLDIETTGTDPLNHSILQIAAEYHQNGKCVAKFDQSVTPGYAKVSLGALRVNKLKAEKVLNGTSNTNKVAQDFADFLLSLPGRGKLTVLGQNVAGFDIPFVKQFLIQNQIEGWDELVSYKVLDTGTIASFLKDAGLLPLEKTSLGDLAKFFGIDVPEGGLHNAAADAAITAQVYYKFVDMVDAKNKGPGLTRSFVK